MTALPFDPHRFRSTAAYYTRYRLPYPEKLIADVITRAGLKPDARSSRPNCGPGSNGSRPMTGSNRSCVQKP